MIIKKKSWQKVETEIWHLNDTGIIMPKKPHINFQELSLGY